MVRGEEEEEGEARKGVFFWGEIWGMVSEGKKSGRAAAGAPPVFAVTPRPEVTVSHKKKRKTPNTDPLPVRK